MAHAGAIAHRRHAHTSAGTVRYGDVQGGAPEKLTRGFARTWGRTWDIEHRELHPALHDGTHGLHGSVSMCLPVPTVEYSNELDQGSKVRIAQFQRHRRPKTTLVDSRRFAPNQCGGALPRTPASFRLSWSRFARHQFRFVTGKGADWNGRASRWLSASRRWRCRPSQPRIGLANRFPGFWSDRTPLAHIALAFGAFQDASNC